MSGWALITGSARRIGRAIALDLAKHGWDIVIHYHHSGEEARVLADEIDHLGRAVCLAEIDLSHARNAETLIPSLAEEIGMIDVLINNAALFEPDEMDPDGTRHWAINADAPRLLSKAFRDHLPHDERGTIINLLDATPVGDHFTAYGKSKAFLSELTLNMAKSLAPQVRVNGLAPGFVLPSPRQSEEAFTKMAGDQRVTPEDVAVALRHLLETPTARGEIVKVRKNAHV
jgi:NAD(P)-dependent dehydrogenase (short-subunit alcohol dehydrogenase family)